MNKKNKTRTGEGTKRSRTTATTISTAAKVVRWLGCYCFSNQVNSMGHIRAKSQTGIKLMTTTTINNKNDINNRQLTTTWTVTTRRKTKQQQVQQQKLQHAEEEEGRKPIKNQASQIIRGRGNATESWLERIDGCYIPDVKWQCVPNRRPKRENVQSPPALPLQDGSGRRRVPTQKWRDREGEHSCRRSERQTGVGEVNSVEMEACKFRKFERRRAFSGAVRVSVWCIQL